MLTRLRNRRRGFTAVELILVIVVLAILTGVSLVQVERQRQAMLREESAANLKVLLHAISELPYPTASG